MKFTGASLTVAGSILIVLALAIPAAHAEPGKPTVNVEEYRSSNEAWQSAYTLGVVNTLFAGIMACPPGTPNSAMVIRAHLLMTGAGAIEPKQDAVVATVGILVRNGCTFRWTPPKDVSY